MFQILRSLCVLMCICLNMVKFFMNNLTAIVKHPNSFYFQYVKNHNRAAAAFYFQVRDLCVPLNPRRRTRKKDRMNRKERLATIFGAAVACLPASQRGSQPVHHEASHPTSKQANRSISFSGATGMGPSNATKQRATVLHHFPSERPSRPQPLITRLCQSAAHKASTTPASLLLSVTAFSHYTAIIRTLYAGEGFYFSFQECQQKGHYI